MTKSQMKHAAAVYIAERMKVMRRRAVASDGYWHYGDLNELSDYGILLRRMGYTVTKVFDEDGYLIAVSVDDVTINIDDV